MNPKHIKVRMDPKTGDLWLTEERFQKPIKRVSNITAHVLLALCADLNIEDDTHEVIRDVDFSDGHKVQIIIRAVPA